MKKGRIISILLLVFVLGLLFINRDRLVSFAQEDNIGMLETNTVVKKGTSFLLEDYVDPDGTPRSCIRVNYFKEKGKILSDEVFCADPIESTHIAIDNDFADYWVVDYIFYDSLGINFNFVPYEYKAPEYHLDCAPNKITMDTYATCTVTADTYYNISNIEFDLDLDDFIIYDEVKLEDVDGFNKDEHHYVLSPKHIDYDYHVSVDTSLFPFNEPVTIKLMEFKIKTEKEQEVAVLGNIKLNNIKYNDISGNATHDVLTATVGQDKVEDTKTEKEEEKPKSNPETVDAIIIAVVLMVISFTLFITIILKNKKISL